MDSTGGSMIIIERLQDECYESYLKLLGQRNCIPGKRPEIKVGDKVLVEDYVKTIGVVEWIYRDESGVVRYDVKGFGLRERDQISLLTPIE